MRILYITTVGMTMRFFQSFICELRRGGHTVDIACADTESIPEYYKKEKFRIFGISCSRSPFDFGNIRAVREIRMIVRKNRYDIVHCHTPVAAACTRLACRPLRTQMDLRVFYTAHGFHFYTGAPRINWIIYYPIEKWLSRYTDVLITINKEDYKRAKKHFKPGKTVYVPGVGIDTKKFGKHYHGEKIREELSIGRDQVMILSVGELNENKNHKVVIRALYHLPKNTVYVIVGSGEMRDNLRHLAEKLGLQKRVFLVGYREDVLDFYDAADLYILPSFREGLNVSLIEAMASGLPCVVSRIRGNTDLIVENNGELCFDPNESDDVAKTIQQLLREDYKKIGVNNKKLIKRCDYSKVNKKYIRVYKEVCRA